MCHYDIYCLGFLSIFWVFVTTTLFSAAFLLHTFWTSHTQNLPGNKKIKPRNSSSRPANSSFHLVSGVMQWELFLFFFKSCRPRGTLHRLTLYSLSPHSHSATVLRCSRATVSFGLPCLQNFLFPHQCCLCVSSWWEHCGRQISL